MEISKELREILEKKYRENSIKTFAGSVKKVCKEVFKREYDAKLLEDTNKVLAYVKTLEKISSQKNTLAGVLAFVKAEQTNPQVIKVYEDHFKTLGQASANLQQYKEPTEDEKCNYIPFAEVIKLRDEHAQTLSNYKIDELEQSNKLKEATLFQKTVFEKYLVLCLYTYVPPLRGEEWHDAVIEEVADPGSYSVIIEARKKNIIDLTHKKLVVERYKTSDIHGTRIIDLPDELVKVIKMSREINNGDPNLLINYASCKPMTSQCLTKFLQSIFYPKKISSTLLRKIYISEQTSKLSVDQRKKLAHIMGHSLSSQEFLYSTFRDKTNSKTLHNGKRTN